MSQTNQKMLPDVDPGVFSGMLRVVLTKVGSVTVTDEELRNISSRPAEVVAMDVTVPGQVTLSLKPLSFRPEVVQ